MAGPSDQVKALLRAHASGDEDLFYSVALQFAAQSARRGHSKVALELRDLIDKSRSEQVSRSKPVPIGSPRGELGELLAISYPEQGLSDMVISGDIAETLDRVIHEQRQRDQLLRHGFVPAHRLLLTGVPGTGKSMTAAALAKELSLPLMTIRLDGVMSRFLGESASKLRLIFDEVARRRAVYLFDEFDALGSDRGATNDIGEARRILNSFLLFLDEAPAESVLIAATNHMSLLDPALFRRFDAVVRYSLPSEVEAIAVIRRRLAAMDSSQVEWDKVAAQTHELSHSDLVKAAERSAKDAILANSSSIEMEQLIAALVARRKPSIG
jgi:SpoVK/Ycf46/Vps4 family AAA+-type ATPase